MIERDIFHGDSIDRRGDERSLLEQLLDVNRQRVVAKASTLSEEQFATQILRGTNLTPGGIVKHLASAEDEWFRMKLLGTQLPEPWASAPEERDWAFESGKHDGLKSVVVLYLSACERSRRAAKEFDSLEDTARWQAYASSERGPFSLRRIYLHILEHTVSHLAHLELMCDAFHLEDETTK